jgi:protease-4
MAASVPFARGLLDTIGLDPQIEARGEYKTAPDSLTQRGFTGAHREMIESLVGDLYDQLVAGIATARKLDQTTLKSLIDRAPLTGKDALDAKLIDRIGYYDEAKDQAIRDAGSGAAVVDLLDYLDEAGRPDVSGPTVALIYGVGTIVSGDGEADPLFDESIMTSYHVVHAFEAAMADARVRAIVFRINSGGGSAVASETIRRALLRAKAAGKPVIVSMSDLAGSGGYWIAMNADKIVAEPATLTGSIGAFAGKVATQGLWKDIGINWGTVSRGQNADMFSPITPFTPTEELRLKSLLDDLYATFTARVAEARNIPLAGVQQIAKGRVWTGNQAAALGLVDKLGGLDTALVLARQAAGLGADAEITVRQFPAPRPAWQRALEVLRGRTEAEVPSATAARLAPLLRQLAPLARVSGEPALIMPPLGIDQ